MPPIINNPKFKIYKDRLDQEGATFANRMGTDDYIEEELPNYMKPMTKDIVGGYRSVVDFPTDVFNILKGLALLYALNEIFKKK